jgi:acyl-CoA synthetase (NDP forming)
MTPTGFAMSCEFMDLTVRHRLAPLLAPRSVALVGASPKPNTPGNAMLRLLEAGGFTGDVVLVNPNYEEIDGRHCWPSLTAATGPVDLAVMSVANARLESALKDAVAAQAKAAVVFASCYLENDAATPLTERIAALARDAGMPLCGGNCMGFYNDAAGVWIGAFHSERQRRPGSITFISHAGSPYGALTHNDPRLRFNLAISAGQELATTIADYLDYAIEQPETRVIGLFIETVRDPAAFTAALEKAASREIPIVALKVARSEASAAMALSHSGAIAGDHASYRALFDRYGVIEVDTIDELASTLLLMAQPRRAAAGGLAVIQDSGGERELVIDLAADLGVPFAKLAPATVERLSRRLEHGLEPVNPLDAWGTGHDFIGIFADCFTAMLDDPDTALGVFFNDIRDDYYVHAGFAEAARQAFARTGKPVAYATNYTQVHHPESSVALTEQGIPVLDGTVPALKAVRHMMSYRDFLLRPADPPPVARPRLDWRKRLRDSAPLSEIDSLELLSDYGLPTVRAQAADSRTAALDAARAIGFPVVVKTAMPGILHKTEHSGVRLGLADEAAVADAYADFAARLGPRVLVAGMAPAGVELALGLKVDPQFGPLVMVAAGGVLIEILSDIRHALAPFGPATARRLIDGLRMRPLLDGVRGAPPADLTRLAEVVSQFSVMAADLAGELVEVDVNPVIAGPDGAYVVDGLVIPRRRPPAQRPALTSAMAGERP